MRWRCSLSTSATPPLPARPKRSARRHDLARLPADLTPYQLTYFLVLLLLEAGGLYCLQSGTT